jgi:hypothetical protein
MRYISLLLILIIKKAICISKRRHYCLKISRVSILLLFHNSKSKHNRNILHQLNTYGSRGIFGENDPIIAHLQIHFARRGRLKLKFILGAWIENPTQIIQSNQRYDTIRSYLWQTTIKVKHATST